MYIGIHVMCKDYNHLLVRDDFLRVSSLEGATLSVVVHLPKEPTITVFSGVARITVLVSVG